MCGVIGTPSYSGRPLLLSAALAVSLAASVPARAQSDPGADLAPLLQGREPGEGLFPDNTRSPDFAPTPEFYNRESRIQVRRLFIFFPPFPPALEAHLPAPARPQGWRAAPAELAAYVNEVFYAPLSTRLAQNDLTPKLRDQLDAYRAAKIALQTELRKRLDSLPDADPLTREHELAAFAAVQTPRLVALEADAEKLRTDLIEGGFLQESTDWNDYRQWQLGVSKFRTPAEAMLAQFQVMRAAVFFQSGLSPAQRRLLREVVMELADITSRLTEDGFVESGPGPNSDTNPLLFFSPETSRLRPPPGLPGDLARKISTYEQEKSALKKELQQAVYEADGDALGFVRARTLSVLAARQQPQFEALEAMAEDIRRGLIRIPAFGRAPPPPSLPADLVARLVALEHDQKASEEKLAALIRQIKRLINVTAISAVADPSGRPHLNVVPVEQDRTEAKLKPVRELIARYNDDTRDERAAFDRKWADLREEVKRTMGADTAPDERDKAARDLMEDNSTAIEEQEEWALYKDYRTAMLEPGLSPEQRRLLYDGGLETLNLPLPSAEAPVMAAR
jgi:hypothetical protein